MSDRLPRPLLAAVGALTQVRRVPGALLTVPFAAISVFDRARRSYDLMVLRGETVLERLGAAEEGPAALPPYEPVVTETDVVTDAISHVADPLDHVEPHAAPINPDEPLPDFDVMTLGALRGTVRSLSVEQLQDVLAYERAHQARPPVLHLVEHRLATLALP